MHQIKILPSFIREKIQNPTTLINASNEDITKWLGYLEITKAYALEEVNHEILAVSSQAQIQLFIHTFLISITELLNTLNSLKNSISPDCYNRDQVIKFYNESAHLLESIINHFKKYYATVLDDDAELPDSELIPARLHLKEVAEKIMKALEREDSSHLVSIAIEPFIEFQIKPNVKFKDWNYLNSLSNALIKLQPTDETDINCEVRKILGDHNFNSKSFIEYLDLVVAEEIKELPTTQEKIDKLIWMRKHLRQLQPIWNLKYDDRMMSSKDYMTNYLEEEIEYYQNKLSHEFKPQPGKKLMWKGPKVALIEFGYSCKEAGYLIEPLQQIFECFSFTFETELNNTTRTWQEILSRKKDENTELSKLEAHLRKRAARMHEEYKPRK